MKMHLSLPVTDIEATAAFYALLLQTAPSKQKHDYVKFEPAELDLNISFARTSTRPDTARHLGLQLETQAELDSHYERLERAGVVVQHRETSVCCYANQDKFWVQDPDGYQWELYVRLEDTEQKMSNTGCCPSDSSAPSCAC